MDQQNLDINQQKMNMPGMQPNHNMFKRQEPQTVKGSGISLAHEVRMEMAKKLDEHNCALHVSLHQYNKHHWLTEGPESFLSLHHLLDEHVEKTPSSAALSILLKAVRQWITGKPLNRHRCNNRQQAPLQKQGGFYV